MKIARTVLTLALVLCIFVSAVGCSFINVTPSAELEQKIYDYLQGKYPGLEFEIKSYTRDIYTSGKYVFKVFCVTTGIHFLVYQSSFLTTDSYTVTYANLAMEEMLVGVLGETIMSDHAKSLQWLDTYADDATGYRFREVDLATVPDSAVGLESIYRITMYAQTTEEALHSLRAITEKLDESGIHCNSISFEWVQNDYTIIFTTDTCTINDSSDEAITTFIDYIDGATQTDDLVNISFVSRVKRVTFSTKDLDPEKFVPGFNENGSENGGTHNIHNPEVNPGLNKPESDKNNTH
ncbi:MAG: hypothetical protein IKM00_00210 [Clostridia bacterium]|nr:hypothetical protein [Clostridia bacterium]